MNSQETYHPLAWLAWLAAAALPALVTRNPLYLTLSMLAVAITYTALGRRSDLARNWGAFVRFGAVLWLLTIPFTALTAHYGTIVLLRLPRSWPVIGGPITLEALLYGMTGGLALLTLLLVFATFNVAVDQARLLRLTPGFMYQAGVVAGIAVAFVPQMVGAWQTIREVQQVRGHRVRGVRDLLPLIIPLLVTALERAMQLAESMEARGFGGQAAAATPRQRLLNQVALLAGLALLGGGLAATGLWTGRQLVAGMLVAAGLLLVGWSFWDQGRRIRRSRYRRWIWERSDRVVLIAGLVGIALWAGVWLAARQWLFYYPYPPFSPWPAFHPLPGLAIVMTVAPGLLLRPERGGQV